MTKKLITYKCITEQNRISDEIGISEHIVHNSLDYVAIAKGAIKAIQ